MDRNIIYSKNQIDIIGKEIAKNSLDRKNNEHLKIVERWRAVHAHPMIKLAKELKRAIGTRKGVVFAQRLKRLDTIVNKLVRYPNMRLSSMQDLGGCRVIFSNLEEVYSFRDSILNISEDFLLNKEKDYIKNPNKDTGYRGIHLIYDFIKDNNYDKISVELQLRTRLQHLWATAVESVGMFTNNGLKFNQGEKIWLDFFRLSSLIFEEEECKKIKTIDDIKKHLETIGEFFNLNKKYGLTKKLYTFATVKIIFDSKKNYNKSGYYLLQLKTMNPSLEIKYFDEDEKSTKKAIKTYAKLELNKDINTDVVLVSAKSIASLQKSIS